MASSELICIVVDSDIPVNITQTPSQNFDILELRSVSNNCLIYIYFNKFFQKMCQIIVLFLYRVMLASALRAFVNNPF